MNGTVFFEFDFRAAPPKKLTAGVMTGRVTSINMTEKSSLVANIGDECYNFAPEGNASFVVLGLQMFPNVSTRELHPEVICHIGASRILVYFGNEVKLDYPPGFISMQPMGMLKLEKPFLIPTRQRITVEWKIVDGDDPPPVVFSVALVGINTREIM